jgi:hypothetical protein
VRRRRSAHPPMTKVAMPLDKLDVWLQGRTGAAAVATGRTWKLVPLTINHQPLSLRQYGAGKPRRCTFGGQNSETGSGADCEWTKPRQRNDGRGGATDLYLAAASVRPSGRPAPALMRLPNRVAIAQPTSKPVLLRSDCLS